MVRAVALAARQTWRGITVEQAAKTLVSNTALRGFAAEAVRKTPDQITAFGVGGKYAKALYKVATKHEVVDQVSKDIAKIKDIWLNTPKFSTFLKDPFRSAKEKNAALVPAFEKLGLSKWVVNCMKVVVENKRAKEIPKIVEQWEDIIAQAKGEVKATITTATAMNDDEVAALKKIIGERFMVGDNIILDLKVEPVIIGGYIVEVGDRRLDKSILTRVEKVQRLLDERA